MPMSEREQFLQNWEREFGTTLRVLKAYPAEKHTLKPHQKCVDARELAWRMVSEESIFVDGAITGNYNFMNWPNAPATLKDIIATYEKSHREQVDKVKNMSDSQFNKLVKFMVAPKTMGEIRSGDSLWMMMMDMIHHRGQFSIYLRMADGKVPSIYGPSGDEPWM